MSDEAKDVAEAIVAERQWPAIVKLQHPVDFGSERISQLEFRRGRMGDLKGLSLEGVPPADQLLKLASRMCGKPIAALELLDMDDCEAVLEIALGFFMRCLGAGGKASPS